MTIGLIFNGISIIILLCSIWNTYTTWKEGKTLINYLKSLVVNNESKNKSLSNQIETLKNLVED